MALVGVAHFLAIAVPAKGAMNCSGAASFAVADTFDVYSIARAS
jgi:hypothetical protein